VRTEDNEKAVANSSSGKSLLSVTEESNSDVLSAGRGTAAPDTDGNTLKIFQANSEYCNDTSANLTQFPFNYSIL
jgi:hypothetical protein